MKWFFNLVMLATLGVLMVVLVGWLLPVEHKTEVKTDLPAPPAVVWETLTDIEDYPQWRQNVQAVHAIDEADVRGWEEVRRGGEIVLFTVEESVPGLRWRLGIRGGDNQLVGSRTFRLRRNGGGTVLKISQRGEIRHPVQRFRANFIDRYDTDIRDYLAQLQRQVVVKQAGFKSSP